VWTFWATALQTRRDPMTDRRNYLNAYAPNRQQSRSRRLFAAQIAGVYGAERLRIGLSAPSKPPNQSPNGIPAALQSKTVSAPQTWSIEYIRPMI